MRIRPKGYGARDADWEEAHRSIGKSMIAVRRILLIPRLRLRMKVIGRQVGYLRLYGVECSEHETEQLRNITGENLDRLGSAMQKYVGVGGRIPFIRALCFGRSAPLTDARIGIDSWMARPFSQGCWVSEMRSAIALFSGEISIERVLTHELVHGLLDVLSNGFPYPIAIQEGFARVAEYFLCHDSLSVNRAKDELEKTPQATSSLTDAQFMSIRDLLFFDTDKHWSSRDMLSFVRMTHMGFWMNSFCARCPPDRPILGRILRELRLGQHTNPADVYSWLQGALRMNASDLEDAFRAYCMTAKVPRGG